MWPEELTFTDRKQAGLRLSQAPAKYQSHPPVVLAMPRGGAAVGLRACAQPGFSRPARRFEIFKQRTASRIA